jgi:nitrous oxidase accessory protein NosD
MKKTLALFLTLAFLSGAVARCTFAQEVDESDSKSTILVDDDKVQCPNAAFTSIQAAVNAANPGDHIRVCPGTYAEQVVVDKSLHIRGDNGAIVIPSGVTVSVTSSSGDSAAAIIFVKDATGVSIRGLIVDGSNSGLTECGPALFGIFYQNASGTISHNAVKHVRLAPTSGGCQSGDAIFVETTGGGTSRVEITDNSVNDYQKNGITANNPGTNASIDSNTVTGIGPTTGAAQNAIQIGFGATGSVTNNSIGNNIWSPCVSPSNCSTNATGVLVFESDGIDVENNSIGTNQIGIFIGGDHSTIRGNTVFNSEVLIGLALVGNQNQADGNQITDSDQAAVFVQGNNNQIRNNLITDAAIGILKIAGSMGTERSGNQFFDTPIQIQDPAPGHKLGVNPAR